MGVGRDRRAGLASLRRLPLGAGVRRVSRRPIDPEGRGAVRSRPERRHLRAAAVDRRRIAAGGRGRRLQRGRGAGAARARAGRTRGRDQRARRVRASGSNRVVFVPGDHDAALLFPAVGRRLVAALAAPAGPRRGRGRRLLAVGRRAGLRRARPSDRLQRAQRSRTGRRRSSPARRRDALWRARGASRPFSRSTTASRSATRSSTTSRLAGAGVKYALAAEGVADAGDAAPPAAALFAR